MKANSYILVNANGDIRKDVSYEDLKEITFMESYDLKVGLFAFAIPQKGLNPFQKARDIISIFKQVAKIETNDPERGGDFVEIFNEYIGDDMRGMLLSGYADSMALDRHDEYASWKADELGRLYARYCELMEGAETLFSVRFRETTNKEAPSETMMGMAIKGFDQIN